MSAYARVLKALGPPESADPEAARRISLLNTMLLGVVVATGISEIPIMAILHRWVDGIVLGVFFLVCLALKWGLHHGWSLTAVSLTFVGMVWLGGTGAVAMTGGLASPLSLMTLPVALAAGLLLGWRVGAGLAVLGFLPAIAIGLLTGVVAPAPILDITEPVRLQGATTAVTFFTVVLLVTGLRELEEAHRQVAQSERKFRTVTEHTTDLITWLGPGGALKYISPSVHEVTGYAPEEIERSPELLAEMVHPGDRDLYDRHIREGFDADGPLSMEYRIQRPDGSIRWLAHSCQPVDGPGGRDGRRASNRDVTERKVAEAALAESERRYRHLMQGSPVPMIVSVDQGLQLANPAAVRALGAVDESELVGRSTPEMFGNTGVCESLEAMRDNPDQPWDGRWFEGTITRLDGQEIDVDAVGIPLPAEDHSVVQLVFMDVTERNRTAEAIRESEERFRVVTEESLVGVYIIQDGRLSYVNPAFAEMFGYQHADELIDRVDPLALVHPDDRSAVSEELREALVEDGAGTPYTFRGLSKSGSSGYFEAYGSRTTNFGSLALVGTVRDVTQQHLFEQRLQHQLENLKALRQIDRAITASHDLNFVLKVFLENTRRRLDVDAASVLLLNRSSGRLRTAACDGFVTDALLHTDLMVGEGYAGTSVETGKMVKVLDLQERPGEFDRSPSFGSEGFASYIAAPLIAKGKVTGVLEILHRQPLDPDTEWFDFLEALAGQAAIAIDNASLFGDLNQSNLELVEAYDTTLEGWAKALELRDMDTEGHSKRVTAMTLRLARELHVSEREIVHMRRGALLHDIGKIGIPDSILRKPGPLDESEWEIMKQHPEYAYRWLATIDFLRPALDIPYCHHEKWDGSGYPRGLKGEEIPLAARIFAVVDVWDALTSDRPYRSAWESERVIEYIRDQAGSHFDPEIAAAFLEILEERGPVEQPRTEALAGDPQEAESGIAA